MIDEIKEFMINLVKEAGDIAVDYLGKAKISSKGTKNVVTEADIAVENHIISQIKNKYPDHNIVAEESDDVDQDSKYTWYIDPIDGTSNYSHGDPHFAVSVGVVKNNIIQYACIRIPMLNETYYAEKDKGTELNGKKITVSNVSEFNKAFIQLGISPLINTIDDSLNVFKYFMIKADRARDYGFCAGQLAFIASGKADGFFKVSQYSWDVAAGMLLVEEAGGKVTDLKGNPVKLVPGGRFNIIASNGLLHDRLLEIVNKDLENIDHSKLWW